MKRFIVLIIFHAVLSAGEVFRLPSSYKNGVKWEFGTNVFRSDILARSNVDQTPILPTVYNKELLVPIARKEPVLMTVYKNTPVIADVYKKKSAVIPIVYKKEPVIQNVRRQQSALIPTVFKTQSNVYKSEPVVVQNVYKQQAAVSTVRKTHPVVSNIYKNQPIRPTVHHREHYFVVPKVLSVDSQKKVDHHVWNYQYNPHHSFVRGEVAHVPHN